MLLWPFLQNSLTSDHELPAGVVSMNSVKPVKSSTSGSNNSADHSGSTSDLSYQDDANDDLDDYIDDADVVSDYDDENNEYVDDFGGDDDDDYLKLQAQFDNVDLPPGVEASVPWLQDPSSSEDKATETSTLPGKNVKMLIASSSKVESSPKAKKEEEMDDVLRKLMYFKQFDTVADCSDHYYLDMKNLSRQVINELELTLSSDQKLAICITS